jgi:TMEM70/TMEM186/TMEM223 protein family
LQKLSLFSLACAVGAGPVIIGLDAGDAFTAKASIAATLAGFGTFTTGLLHWFTHPYVHRLTYDPASQDIRLDVLNFLARPKTVDVNLKDVRPAETMHPLASFSVGEKSYHVDGEYFADKELLAKLTGKEEAGVTGEEARGDKQQQTEPQQ